jgi:hypothetical protein
MSDDAITMPVPDSAKSENAQIAARLEQYADEMKGRGAAGLNTASAAMSLVRAVDPDAADSLRGHTSNRLVYRNEQAEAYIRGAAETARLHGPITPAPRAEADTATSQNINVSATAEATAVATATAKSVAKTSLDLMTEWPDIPEDAKVELEAMKRAIEEEDKTSLIQHAAEASKLLGTFPPLLNACIELGTNIGGVLQSP